VRPAPGPLIGGGVALWFAGTAVLTVWLVFRDPSFDYRLVIVGALLPDLVDAAFGGSALAHSVLGSVVLLGVVMVVTIGHRSLRRHLIALPIGTFLHLVFDGAFTRTQAFWWPLAGGSLAEQPLPVVSRGAWNVLLELIGLGILIWVWQRFGLGDTARRRRFVRTGRLDPTLVC
jgi:hypothetical protein